MSAAWEVTTDDIEDVLRGHEIVLLEAEVERLLSCLDTASIERGILYFTNMDDQTLSALEDIEKQLIACGTIPADAPRKFVMGEGSSVVETDEDWDEDWDEDEEP